MAITLFALLLAFTLTNYSFAGPNDTPEQPVFENGWAIMAGSDVTATRKQLIEQYTNQERKAPEKDKPLYRAFIGTAEKLENSPKSLDKFLTAHAVLLKGLQLHHPNDLEMQIPLVTGLYTLGMTMEQEQRLRSQGQKLRKEAERDTRELLKKHPNNPRLHHLMGDIHLQSGRKSEARLEFEKCIAIDPKNERCRSGLNSSKPLDTPNK